MEDKIEKTFEIRDDEINIKEIEKQIRDNIINRKKLGVYSKDVEDIIKQPLLPPIPPGMIPSVQLDRSDHIDLLSHMNYINSNWDIRADYKISSHRPIMGMLLVWGRKVVNNEVKRYVDILIVKQSVFNMHITSVLNSINNRITDTNNRMNDIGQKINNISNIIDDINNRINDTNNRIEKMKKYSIIESDSIMNYFLFENKYRGSIEDIKKKQSIYLEYFKNCQNVLDIGCGRGEFLTLLKENNVDAKGIDINENMVSYCQKNHLNVEKIDAISYLQSLENESLDGIFSSQVIEHLQPRELVDLIKLCYDKMIYGNFVIETINPLCLNAHINFYADFSHSKLIHPETLKFLLESAKFEDVQIKFLNQYPEKEKLDKLIMAKNDEKENKNTGDKNIEIINTNIDKLNSLLFGYQDYVVIARKLKKEN